MSQRLVEDAVRRTVAIPRRPARIVSLVPSVTELLVDLGAGERVVGVSSYCTEPAHLVGGLARVGGQKDPDLDTIVACAPDLVVAVKEENLERDVLRLEARGVPVYVADVNDLEDAVAWVGELGGLVDAEHAVVADLMARIRGGIDEARRIAAAHAPRRVFVAVWRDPWIGVARDTYGGDVVEACGGRLVTDGAIGTGDRRYPKMRLDALAQAQPEVVLLPDEPYAFSAADRDEVRRLLPSARVAVVPGKTLFWYGRRTAEIALFARLLAGDTMPP